MQLPARGPRVDWSIHVRDLVTGDELAAHEPDLELSAASIGKVLLLIAASSAIDHEPDLAHELLDRRSVALVADSGLWQHLAQPRLALEDCCVLVAAVSDNLATNVLIERLGLAPIQSLATELGVDQVALHDVVRDARAEHDAPTLSTASARGLTALLARLHAGTVVSPAADARVVAWLERSVDLSMVASALDLDPLAHGSSEATRIANKTGTDARVRADCGIVTRGDRSLAYAAIANWPPGHDLTSAVMRDLRALGAAIAAHVGIES